MEQINGAPKVKSHEAPRSFSRVLMILVIISIASYGFAVKMYLEYFGLFGTAPTKSDLDEVIYNPVIFMGAYIAPVLTLISHFIGLSLIYRFRFVSKWWIANYVPLIFTSLVLFVSLSTVIPTVLIALILVIIALAPVPELLINKGNKSI